MKSPIVIIAELVAGLISSIISTMIFVITKFLELISSLMMYSSSNLQSFAIAAFLGAVVFILITKFIFKSSKTLLSLGIALIAIVAVLVFFWTMA